MAAPLQFSAGSQPRRTRAVAGWTLLDYDQVGSTNLVAATLPIWHAALAEVQSQGRGRFQRSWISDKGGLWLSAVVPHSTAPEWRLLPLVVGLAVWEALSGLGVPHLRMRWPNDLLVENRKIAGLLLDQFVPGRAVAGIGINVHNCPEACDGRLTGQTARLAEFAENIEVASLADRVLQHLREAVLGFEDGIGRTTMVGRINQLWKGSRQVELDLDGRLERGTFKGVDDAGRLALSDTRGAITFYDASQVRHLTELEH